MTDKKSAYSLDDFDFYLPKSLIAQSPAATRSGSQLLDASITPFVDHYYRELPILLQPNDLLIFNNTKVIKARLYAEKMSGGKCEILVERVLSCDERGHEFAAHLRVSKKPTLGQMLHIATHDGQPINLTMMGRWPDEKGSLFRLKLDAGSELDSYTLLEKYGRVPLPPYISHADSETDVERYQTVFARHQGAIAAPTAALHFDESLLLNLKQKGIEEAFVTLHVGAGTFSPVKTQNLADHIMHQEWYSIPEETLEAIEKCRGKGGRVIAVGTTSVRALESYAKTGLKTADTQIFITPGFDFKIVDMLLTNFHLPKSTLMMLVSAFAGFECIKEVYRIAIERKYRFFSYGDGMLLKKQGSLSS